MGLSGSGWGLGPEPGLVQGCPIPAQRLSQGWPRAGQDCAGARPKLWRLGAASGLWPRASEGSISLALVVLSLIHFFSCLAARHKVVHRLTKMCSSPNISQESCWTMNPVFGAVCSHDDCYCSLDQCRALKTICFVSKIPELSKYSNCIFFGTLQLNSTFQRNICLRSKQIANLRIQTI